MTSNTPINRKSFIDSLNLKKIDIKNSLIPLYGIREEDNECTCSKKCSSKGKHPIYSVKKFNNLSIEDRMKKIEDETRYNLGIYCGSLAFNAIESKSLIVIDIDDKDYLNSQILKDIRDKDSDKLETFKYKTGSGKGMHLWYWYHKSEAIKINNSVKLIYDNVDIRSDGGLVVIPTSKSVNSKFYEFFDLKDVDKPILELPTFLLESILSLQGKQTVKRKSTGNKMNPRAKKPILFFPNAIINKKTIQELRKEIIEQNKYKIPLGTRNITLFKLLSQDRRQGTNKQTIKELYCKAKTYRDMHCEDPTSISNKELYLISRSAFNSNKPMKMVNVSKMTYKDLAHNYFIWVKNNRSLQYSEDAKEKMIKVDEQFFETKIKDKDYENDKEIYVSLQHISDARDKYMEANNLTTYFRYPLKHLAKKLIDLGYKRKRTSKGNVWKVHIILDNESKMSNKIYNKCDMNYHIGMLTMQAQKKVAMTTTSSSSTMPTTTTAVPPSLTNDEEVNEKIKKLPNWAVQDKAPDIIIGVKFPDLVNDPNAIPLFTPPGFQDEHITKLAEYMVHDEEPKYVQFKVSRRTYMELNEAYSNFIDTLTPQEQRDFQNEDFLRDEELTALHFDQIKEGQIIGCMIQSDPTATYALEVLKVFQNEDTLACRPWNGYTNLIKYKKYPNEIKTTDPEWIANKGLIFVTFQDISYSLAMNNFVILYEKKDDSIIEQEKEEILKKNPNAAKSFSPERYFSKIHLFKPFGYEGKFKEYNMIIRYRIAQGFPGHVDDTLLEQEYTTAHASYLEEHKDKIEAKQKLEQEEYERKQKEKQEKLQKIKDELNSLS